jgi:hypothetical protein
LTRQLCGVEGCGRSVRSRGYCNPHYRRWQRHGDPRAALPIASKTTGDLSYWSMHHRLKIQRGPASAHPCAGCGAAAVCWSYVGGDPDERIEPRRRYRYSIDVAYYLPRCRSCHRRATTAAPRVDVGRASRLYLAGASGSGIAALLGVSRSAVYQALRANGVPIRARQTLQTDPRESP